MKSFTEAKSSFSKVAAGSALVAALLALGSVAHGQGYSTNFDATQGYVGGATLSGQNSWDTNDNNQPDFVGTVSSYSVPATDFVGYLGGLQLSNGIVPSVSPVYLFRPFTLGTTSAYAFNVDMAITRSGATYPNNDSFAWTFRTAAGANLFSVDFAPQTANDSNGARTTLAVRYTVNGAAQQPTGNGLLSDAYYHLTVSVNVTAKQFSVSLTPTGGTTMVLASNVSLGTNDPSTLAQVAATWNDNVANPGANTLIFNNYAVTVPEPSTWVMLGLGAVGVTVMFRRRAQA